MISTYRQSQAQHIKELQALQVLTDTALAHLQLDTLFHDLLPRIQDIMGVDNIAILLLEPGKAELRVRAVRGLEEAVATTVVVPVGQGFAGQIAATALPLIVNDVATYPVVTPFLHEHLHSLAGVPLIVAHRVVGVLHIGTVAPTHFSSKDIALLERVALRIALALERSNLYEQERAKTHEINAIFDALIDGVIVLDIHGNIVRVNQALIQLFDIVVPFHKVAHLPIEERIARFGLRTGDGRLLTSAEAPQMRVLRGEQFTGLQAMNLYAKGQNGQDCVVNVTGTPLYDVGGTIRGGILVFRDITEWHKIERMREDFVNIAGHEFRTPMTSMVLSMQLLEQRLKRNEPFQNVAGIFDTLQQSVHRLNRLIDDMLDVTKISTGHFTLSLETFDLAEVIRQAAAEIGAAWERAVLLSGVDNVIEVSLDRGRLWQVLTNLLTNACKYTPQTALVGVTVQVEHPWAKIIVWDKGPGIAADMLPQLFERYYRGEGQDTGQMGLGLGLFIVKQILEKLGGTIQVTSSKDDGTSFVILLPLANS